MKCVIMQPTFFPWAGYFYLASQADVFVFLDDVQLEKQSWQTRNCILLNGKAAWISVPLIHMGSEQKICEVEVFDQSLWRIKLLRKLAQTYARHPFCDVMLKGANLLGGMSETHLADINILLITDFCNRFGIQPRFARSSRLGISGDRTERLIRICEHFGCQEYLSPAGSADYLAQDRFTERTNIRLSLQKYEAQVYPQYRSNAFISHLSVIDVVANLGWDGGARYVRGETIGTEPAKTYP